MTTYAATREGKIAMWQEMRAKARSVGDMGVVRMTDQELARLGFETTQGPELETAVPEKPHRGRKPLPRCEHNMILVRCPECSPESRV